MTTDEPVQICRAIPLWKIQQVLALVNELADIAEPLDDGKADVTVARIRELLGEPDGDAMGEAT
jgi:hypothetical protein